MKHSYDSKRVYLAPALQPTEVAFERALLVTTNRLLMTVDESENVNASIDGADDEGGEMYFEF